MNEKTIAAIALRDNGYSDFAAIMAEAAQWVEFAGAQGANLAVLPETINLYQTIKSSAPLIDLALDDWWQQTAPLRESAVKSGVSLVLPLLVRENGVLANRYYILSSDGSCLGHFQKRVPAPGEQAAGMQAGQNAPVIWEGLTLGGAICFDVYYPHRVFDPQMEHNPDLFVIPSLTPGGSLLDAYALTYGVPIVLAYPGWSRILDRDGRELAAGGHRWETLRFGFASPVIQATINFDSVTLFADLNQQKMRDVQRHYGRGVRIRFDQPNCLFTLESRSVDLSVSEVMHQFGLVSRRDYFAKHDPQSQGNPCS